MSQWDQLWSSACNGSGVFNRGSRSNNPHLYDPLDPHVFLTPEGSAKKFGSFKADVSLVLYQNKDNNSSISSLYESN